uniref:C2H2-type domain-containing protein n=1 Tax=Haemonchus contortus TaxID=6289 RepID=A0A7I4YGE4_HAECO
MELVKENKELRISSVAVAKNPRRRKPPRPPIKIRQCRFCERWMDQNTLMDHLQTLHGEHGIEEAEKMLLAREKKVKCEVRHCGYIAKSEYDYKVHMRKTHFLIDERKYRHMICPLCAKSLNAQEDLVEHCLVVHEVKDCVIQARSFKDAYECEMWKESIAKTHCTAWLINGRSNVNGNLQVAYYRCSRVFKNRYRWRSSEPRKSPTMAVANYCTSFLKEIYAHDGTVTVKYCLGHVYHDVSPANLPLSNSDKAVIANYLRQGFDAEVVREMIRREFTDPKTKLHHVTTSDIKKILSNLASSQRRLEEIVGTSDESIREFSEPISASALLQAPSDSREGSACDDIGDEAVNDRSSGSDIPAESLSACSSCAKLTERVAELEAIVKKLNSKVLQLEGAHLYDRIIKVDSDSLVKQEMS